MPSKWLNPLALTTSCLALALVADGAAGVSTAAKVSLFHQVAGMVTTGGALACAAMLSRRHHKLALVILAAVMVAAGAGLLGAAEISRGLMGVAHAVSSHALFAALAVASVESRPQAAGGIRVEDAGWPPLRSLAWLAPVTLLGQVSLGAAYRHQLLTVVPHITGAFIAGVVVLMAGAFLLTLEGANRRLRVLAAALISVTLLQILLGVAAYFARVAAQAWMPALTVVHVIAGAVLLALSSILSVQIFRDVITVRPPAAVRELAGSSRNG